MKKQNKDTLLFLYRVSDKKKLHIAALLLIQILLGMSSVFYALLFRNVIDSATAHDTGGVFRSLAEVVFLFLFQIAAGSLGRFLQEDFSADLVNTLRTRLFETLLLRSYEQVSAGHTGEWMNRLTSDTAVVVDGMVTILPGLSGLLAKLCGALVMLIYIEPRFVCLLLPGGILLGLLAYFLRKHLKTLHKNVQEADGRVRVRLQEHLESLIIIKTFSVQKKSSRLVQKDMRAYKEKRMRKTRFSILCSSGFALAMNGAYFLGIAYSAYGIYHGTLSLGTLMALLQLIGQIQAPFAGITGYLPRYYAMLGSAERLLGAESFRNEKEPVAPENAGDFNEFGLCGASFSYKDPQKGVTNVFSDLDLTVRNGEFIAFTGASGCGKSTVLKLLLSLYDLETGEKYICFNGNKKLLDASFRPLFAYVPQGNLLMSGSIREIVTFSQESADSDTDASIEKALKAACAYDFVSALEDGLDTVLGERGAGLSEGQMQRLSIARAIYSGRPVLLLDEATSALDEQTEKQLLENLRALTDKTVIIVTHRPAVLSVCDREICFLQPEEEP